MKKIYLLIATIFCSAITLAQSKINDYQSVYFKKSYDINASQDKNDTSKYSYFIDCASLDKLHSRVCLDFESQKLNDFITYLRSAKQTYAKWMETAKTNNVTELDKIIDIKDFNCTTAFIYGDWNFDFSVSLTPKVKIVDGKTLLIITSGELQSSSNQFMKHDGLALVFMKPEEVEDFIAKIDLNNVKAFFNKKNKSDSLFKN